MLIQIYKLDVDQNILSGHGQKLVWSVGHEPLNSTLSQEWTEGINWFFECCYKFRENKNYFNDFWVFVMRIEGCLKFNETLKVLIRMDLWIELIFYGALA